MTNTDITPAPPYTIIEAMNPSNRITAEDATINPMDFGPLLNEAFHALRPICVGMDEQLVQAMFALGAIEHVLWNAGPGVAKSFAAEKIMSLFVDADTLKLQLTKDMPQEALFGHVVAEKLIKEGVEERNGDGGVGDVHFFFADEMLDASPWLLRVMLNVLNERKVRSKDQGEMDAPLHTVFATTNFFRQTGEMEAVIDRFLARSVMPSADDLADHYQIGRGYTKTGSSPGALPQLHYADLLAFGKWIETPESVDISDAMMILHYALMQEFRERRYQRELDEWALRTGTDRKAQQNTPGFKEPTHRDLGVDITPRTAAKAIDFAQVSAGIDSRGTMLPVDLRAAGMVYCTLGDGSGDSELWAEVCNEYLTGLSGKQLDVLNDVGSLISTIGELRAQKGQNSKSEFWVGGKMHTLTRQNALQFRSNFFGLRKPHPAIQLAFTQLDDAVAKLTANAQRTGIIVSGWE